jgi:hypothetical protein
MSVANKFGRAARFESLEQRQLLAGDVLVNVVRGDLVIQGDAADNEIAITAGAEPGSYVVTGLNGTTVHQNGQDPASDVTVTGVRRDVRIGMGEGNDSVSIEAARVRGDVLIRTGTGNDEVSVDDVGIGGRLAIGTDGGDDTVSLGSATEEPEPTPTGARGGDLEGALRVRKGIHVDLGTENDTLTLDQVATSIGVGVNAGSGDDSVSAEDASGVVFAVLGGDGTDTISLADLRARHLGVHAGAGDDDVAIADSIFSTLGVALGAGDDTLSIGGNQARIAVLLGGTGEDTLEEPSENEFRFEFVRGFEVPDDANGNTPLPRFLADLLDRLDDVSEERLRDLLAGFVGGWGPTRRR